MEGHFQLCLEKAIDYLSRRDHSEKELCIKLKKKNFDRTMIEKTIHWLIERGYLRPPNEMSKILVETLLKKGKGKHYIIQYIKSKGLPPPENFDFDSELEFSNAKKLVNQFLKKMDYQPGANLDRALKEKMARKLINRGYPIDIALKAIRESELIVKKIRP